MSPLTKVEIERIIREKNDMNWTGSRIGKYLMDAKAKRQIVLEVFRELGYAAKSIGSRVYISDAVIIDKKRLIHLMQRSNIRELQDSSFIW